MADQNDFATAVGALVRGARWVKRDLVAGEDLNNLREPGEYVAAPWAVSSTLLNAWSSLLGTVIVHPQYAKGTTGVRYVLQERWVGATTTGDPIRKATRALQGDGTWTPWVEERAEARTYADARLVDAKAYTDSVAGSATADPSRVAAFGDSLTDGGANGQLWPDEEAWPGRMGTALGGGYTVTNAGFSGASVDEMLMRVGALPVRLTIPTGGIASNANQVVTPAMVYGMPNARRDLPLRWNGSGVQLIVDAGVWTLYNWTPSTIPAGTVTLDPQMPGLAGDTAVVWIGRNDVTFGVTGVEGTVVDHIVAGHQRLIEWLTPRVKHLLILGVTPRTIEPSGSANGTIVAEVDRRLRETYPGKFASVTEYLQGPAITDMGLTPTQADTDAVAAGVLPPAVMATGDNTHINKDAAQVIGEHFVKDALTARGWL